MHLKKTEKDTIKSPLLKKRLYTVLFSNKFYLFSFQITQQKNALPVFMISHIVKKTAND